MSRTVRMRPVRRSKWIFRAILSAVFFGFAALLYPGLARVETARDAAEAQGVPPVVSLDKFDPQRDVHPLNEVNLAVRIDPRLTQRVVVVTEGRKRRGSIFGRSNLSSNQLQMYVLTAPDTASGGGAGRALVLIDHEDIGAFEARIGAEAVAGRTAFELGGVAKNLGWAPDLALRRVEEGGGSLMPGAFLVTPFDTTREAFVAGSTTVARMTVLSLAGLGLLFYVLAWKAMRARRAWLDAEESYGSWQAGVQRHEPARRPVRISAGTLVLMGVLGAIVAQFLK